MKTDFFINNEDSIESVDSVEGGKKRGRESPGERSPTLRTPEKKRKESGGESDSTLTPEEDEVGKGGVNDGGQ